MRPTVVTQCAQQLNSNINEDDDNISLLHRRQNGGSMDPLRDDIALSSLYGPNIDLLDSNIKNRQSYKFVAYFGIFLTIFCLFGHFYFAVYPRLNGRTSSIIPLRTRSSLSPFTSSSNDPIGVDSTSLNEAYGSSTLSRRSRTSSPFPSFTLQSQASAQFPNSDLSFESLGRTQTYASASSVASSSSSSRHLLWTIFPSATNNSTATYHYSLYQ